MRGSIFKLVLIATTFASPLIIHGQSMAERHIQERKDLISAQIQEKINLATQLRSEMVTEGATLRRNFLRELYKQVNVIREELRVILKQERNAALNDRMRERAYTNFIRELDRRREALRATMRAELLTKLQALRRNIPQSLIALSKTHREQFRQLIQKQRAELAGN